MQLVTGRTMFDAGQEPWQDTPPFRASVFVVTHRPRDRPVRDGVVQSPQVLHLRHRLAPSPSNARSGRS
jgi:hypothetical protein